MKQIAITLALSFACAAFARAQDAGLVITHAAARPSRVAPVENFTGVARVQPLFDTTAMTRAYGASVSFDPGARTAWHTHLRGQVLIVTEGVGRVQRWGAPVEEVRPGDVVRMPPNVKHWHGAAPTSAMTHVAIVENLDGKNTDWMEKVSDSQYGAPVRAQETSAPNVRSVPGDSALIEAITHLAFYTGWPNAIMAVTVAREVLPGSGR